MSTQDYSARFSQSLEAIMEALPIRELDPDEINDDPNIEVITIDHLNGAFSILNVSSSI